MNKQIISAGLACLIGALAFGVCAAAPARSSDRASLIGPALSSKSQVPAAVKQKLLSRTTRAATVNNVMADPKMRAVVTTAASGAGLAASQLSALASKPLASLATSLAAQLSEDKEYSSLDWANGLTFAPFSVPSYSNGKYHVGDMLLYSAMVRTFMPGLIEFYGSTSGYGQKWLDLYLDLPKGPGIYAFTLKFLKYDGTCPADLIGPDDGTCTRPIRVRFSYCNEAGQTAETSIYFSPLADQSGYVGVASINVGDGVGPLGMMIRKLNGAFTLSCAPSNTIQNCLFSGLTITKI